MSGTTRRTSNPVIIRRWTEQRGGHPARVAAIPDGGVPRIAFGKPEAGLELIGWDRFFEIVHKRELAFLYQEETEDGSTSKFYKFILQEER